MILAAERSLNGWPVLVAFAILVACYRWNLRKERNPRPNWRARRRAEREQAERDYEAAMAHVQAQNLEYRRRRAEAEMEAQIETVFYDQKSEREGF